MNESNPESLISALHEAASDVSYFLAAEGSDWGRESLGRERAIARWNNLREIAIERGIFNKDDFKGYLV